MPRQSLIDNSECFISYSDLASTIFTLSLADPIQAKVAAWNAMGWSDYASGSGDILRTAPLAPPTNPGQGSATSESQVEVTWSAVTNADAGWDTVTAYYVYWDTGSSNWALLYTDTSPFAYSLTFSTGIAAGGSYVFKYQAEN
mmetsp:Transcript_21722/g.16028  ORF Transcript_21722/g.16028 Transcript_21722/m.16028 type:complete len:143 (-) Transcript_21722:59-487(-)